MAKNAADVDPKAQLEARFREGKITFEELEEKLAELNRTPTTFDIGEKGWLKIKCDGLRFPVNMPYELAIELFSEEGADRARRFLKDNKSRFTLKKDRNTK